MFQILTTKGKGMVVGNPAPGAPPGILRQSSASPGSARLLTVNREVPWEAGGFGTPLTFLKCFEIYRRTTNNGNIKHQGKYWQGCGEVILLLHKHLIKCDLSTIGDDYTWRVEVNYF